MRTVICLSLLLLGCSRPANTQQVVEVTATVESGTTPTYAYTVVNQAAKGIVRVRLGENPESGVCDFHVSPLGWNAESGLPASSGTAPMGWRVSAFGDEGAETDSWCVDFTAGGTYIPHGQTLSGFSITTETSDANYANGFFEVLFVDGTTFRGEIHP
jgi:hypothetical protein